MSFTPLYHTLEIAVPNTTDIPFSTHCCNTVDMVDSTVIHHEHAPLLRIRIHELEEAFEVFLERVTVEQAFLDVVVEDAVDRDRRQDREPGMITQFRCSACEYLLTDHCVGSTCSFVLSHP